MKVQGHLAKLMSALGPPIQRPVLHFMLSTKQKDGQNRKGILSTKSWLSGIL